MHITKWMKPIWKGCLLYDSNNMTFWKRQNYADGKKIMVARGWGAGGMTRWNTALLSERSYTAWRAVGHDITHLCKSTEWTTWRGNPNVSCGLWVIMMCQERFVCCIEYTTLVWDADYREAMHLWGQVVYGKSLYLPLQFTVHLKLL